MQCPRCLGSGQCAECSGQGSIECPTCQGQGKRSTGRGVSYDCKACQATGALECAKECSSCAGSGRITEQLQRETREKYHIKFVNYGPSVAAVVPLLALNLVVYVALQVNPQYVEPMLLTQDSLSQGRFWTILTPSFMHVGALHLICNLWFLWVYGPVVEGLLGKRKFLLLYLVSGLSASALSYFGNIHMDGDFYAGIGASGPLFGLMGAILAVHIRWKMIPPSEVRRLTAWGVGLIVLGFALRGSSFDLIDTWAHLGGGLGGFILSYFLPRPGGH